MRIHHSVFKNPFEVKTQDVDGMPRSIDYDDRFFQADAINEIYDVFIKPNNLEDHFKNLLQSQLDSERIVLEGLFTLNTTYLSP